MLGITQTGKANTATLNQDGGDSEKNVATITQIGENDDATVTQKSTAPAGGGKNKVTISSTGGNNNDVTINQTSRFDNTAKVTQENGGDNSVNLTQLAGTKGKSENWAEIVQGGDGNKLYGADYCGIPLPGSPATQIAYAKGASNYLDLVQRGGYNEVGLYQESDTGNNAYIEQRHGDNKLVTYQYTSDLGNMLDVHQSGDDIALICQTASQGNSATIIQNDNNKLVGADPDPYDPYSAIINENKSAQQHSLDSYNTLLCNQSGGGNEVGLYQSASGFNYADIDQLNGGNSLAVYQTTTAGYNSLTADMSGGNIATVRQESTTGNNIATVH
jgi:hypothetical protein